MGCDYWSSFCNKSPALSEIMKPLNQLEVEAKGVYDEEQKEYNAMAMRVKIQQDLAKDQAKKDLKNGRPAQEIDRGHKSMNPDNSRPILIVKTGEAIYQVEADGDFEDWITAGMGLNGVPSA